MIRTVCIGLNCKLLAAILVILPVIHGANLASASSAVCFLTRQPSLQVIRFASQLAQNIPNIDVFIVVDDHNASLPIKTLSHVRLLLIDEAASIQDGFQEANVFGTNKTCSAWDKALYYFSKVATSYSFVWFVEEDVFIPSVQAFLSLHKLYSPAHDLVTTELNYNTNGNTKSWFHWPRAVGALTLPWGRGMVCAVGCSRRLLSRVSDYVKWRGELTFIEFLLHTIAIHDSHLKLVTPFELNTILYRQGYTFEQIRERPNNWWHPVKQLTMHDEWRNWLARNLSASGKQILVEFHALNRRINRTARTKATSKLRYQLKDLLAKLEIIKDQLSSSDRHRLRDGFLRLAENRTDGLAVELRRLADHAFQLSKPYFDPYADLSKTKTHVMIEEAIASKKATIYRLTRNDVLSPSTMTKITQLRKEIKDLIIDLTHEIKCEQKTMPCNRTEQRIQQHYKMKRYFRRDSSELLGVLAVFLLSLLLILYRVKTTKDAGRRSK